MVCPCAFPLPPSRPSWEIMPRQRVRGPEGHGPRASDAPQAAQRHRAVRPPGVVGVVSSWCCLSSLFRHYVTRCLAIKYPLPRHKRKR